MAMISTDELAILVVEPSHFQQKIILSELKELGCRQLDTAETIQQALEFMGRYTPDLVISAMYLPDGSGIELVSQMRTDPALEGIPYMLISSEQRMDVLDPIRQAGSVAILPKPFQVSDLNKALQATLEFVDPTELELEDYEADQLSILVVDDSEFSLKHISRALENIGIGNVVRAHNGQEAIDQLDQHSFDLIFTDFNMPEMDGEQLTQYVRNESNQPYVPILLVTSEQNETRLTGVRQSGVNAVCNKPFDTRQVKAMIKNLLTDA
ncbi:response regulator [Motiliproteus coralliicola]|uniref:Response regulator n=1 Tax=Motiliproteus coralliicola TaxID=2283196 RepID=A0A369WRF7_9GAMM|nr:response regulator [Motiliproteus coralliicola]RDE24698.1 response regulator [Motiliproteus coralliicola]